MLMNFSKSCADQYPLHGVYVFECAELDACIVVCDHELEPILKKIQPRGKGYVGIALEFNCNESWKERDWIIPDLDLEQDIIHGVLREFPKLGNHSSVNAFLTLIHDAIESHCTICISYKWGGK